MRGSAGWAVVDAVIVERDILGHGVATIGATRSMKAITPSRRSSMSMCSGWAPDSIAALAPALAFSMASASVSASTVNPS